MKFRFLRSSLISIVVCSAVSTGCASGGDGRPDTDAMTSRADAGIDGAIGDFDAGPGCAADSECDDGNPCNGVESCSASRCAAGTPVDCDDSVACTTDSCSATDATCAHTPDDALCGTGLVCDAVDGCAAPRPCTTDTDCDDAVTCNGAETCDPAFGCRRGTAPTCDDGLACTTDSCDATTDACVHAPDAMSCDDGLACDGVEACDPTDPAADGNGCVVSAPPVCDDGVPCTMDSCDESAGGCTTTPDDAVCGDGVFCNGAERCTATGCAAGTAPACDDGIGCTTGSCDAATDRCMQTGSDAFCADGMVCNGTERCDVTGTTPGRGCVAGAPMDCSDGLPCTTDSCVEPGTCRHGGSDADGDGYTAVGCAGGNDCDDLTPTVHPGATELCDGIDNDCSGTADDAPTMQCALGSAPRSCTTACGSPGLQACNATCRLAACIGVAEVCNDCDDDLNGLVDDGLLCRRGTSMSCTTSCGTTGSRTCAADCGSFGACAAASETCNDCDDNGNGMVDEGLPCRRSTSASCTTSCGTAGSRVCAVDCSGYGLCRAAAETCNACDDDGDGAIDEDFACRQGSSSGCTTTCGTAGTRTCAADCSAYGSCRATEVCNGCDDDADGTIDNGFTCPAGASRACTTACGGPGTQTCNGSCTGWSACTAPEVCNGCDDDGVGGPDNGFTCVRAASRGCTTGCGTAGSQSCNATCSGYGACSAAEVCNGCDDDGVGGPDNGFTCVQGAASSCATACGTTGSRTCNGTCTGYSTCSATEVCNGCDDDGVGGPDNGFTCVQGAASSCTTACSTPGTRTCNGTCSGYGACNGAEVCNGCDDDGVGGPDNGFTCVQGVTSACTTACSTAGTRTCNGTCSGYSTCVAAAEICGNGCDDNGNGMIDEGCGPVNDLCTSPTAISLASSSQVISGTTTGAVNNIYGGCGCTSGQDVFYSFTLAQTEYVWVNTLGSVGWDISLYFTDAACTPLAARALPEAVCNDDGGPAGCGSLQSQIFAVLAAGTYRLGVSGCGSGAFDMTFAHYPVGLDGNGGPIAAGSSSLTGTINPGAGVTLPGCSGGGRERSFYWLTCPSYAGGAFTASLCASTAPIWDTYLELYQSNAAAPVCDDDSCGGVGFSVITATPIPAGVGFHALYVDTYSSVTLSGARTFSAAVTRP